MASARPLIPHPTNNAQPTISPESWARSLMTSQEIIGDSTSEPRRDSDGTQAQVRTRRELKANVVGSAFFEAHLLPPCYSFGVSHYSDKCWQWRDLNPRFYFLFRFD